MNRRFCLKESVDAMQEYVLFSPVGTTDPMGIRKKHIDKDTSIDIPTDGPMIRVCRIYRPKKVYLLNP